MNHTDDPTKDPTEPGSVTRLIKPLISGDREAAGTLWCYFYHSLVEVAARRLDDALHAATGPDDVAQESLVEFCQSLAAPGGVKRFPRLQSRQDLWRLLVCFTVRRVCDVSKKYIRRTAIVAGESALGEVGIQGAPGAAIPEGFSLAVEELLAMLPDDMHRKIAVMRIEGYSNAQIAQQVGRAVTTVEVKLKTIRSILKPRLQDYD